MAVTNHGVATQPAGAVVFQLQHSTLITPAERSCRHHGHHVCRDRRGQRAHDKNLHRVDGGRGGKGGCQSPSKSGSPPPSSEGKRHHYGRGQKGSPHMHHGGPVNTEVHVDPDFPADSGYLMNTFLRLRGSVHLKHGGRGGHGSPHGHPHGGRGRRGGRHGGLSLSPASSDSHSHRHVRGSHGGRRILASGAATVAASPDGYSLTMEVAGLSPW